MRVCIEVPSILGKVFFKALPQDSFDKRCKACGNKTVFSLIANRIFHDSENIVYPCCRKIECYNKVVKSMEKHVSGLIL